MNGPPKDQPSGRDRYKESMKDIVALHQAEYDAPPECVAHAPGVVKFLGEHTETAEGLVLAAAVSFEIHVAVSARKDSALRFYAADFGERKRAATGTLKYKREDRWANFPKAAYDMLSRNGFAGRGVNFTISGEIPMGLGLGSSSALGLASSLALKGLFGLPQKNEELAEIACKAESAFMERPVPIYDFLAATAPGSTSMSVVDLRSSRRRAVQFLDGPWQIVLTDSKVPRISVDPELRQREDDCRKCLTYVSSSGTRSLREVKVVELDELMGILPESIRRRCLHVVEEISRVSEAEDALVRRDAAAFGRIVNKSHNSLRTLYEVSCPEIDWLVKRALEIDGVLCSRLTGKGFGGCTISVMKPEAIPEYRKRLEDYERIFGFKAQVHEAEISGGLRLAT